MGKKKKVVFDWDSERDVPLRETVRRPTRRERKESAALADDLIEPLMALRPARVPSFQRSRTQLTLLGPRAVAEAEITPIDDVRSTADYRRTVTGNLGARFLTSLKG